MSIEITMSKDVYNLPLCFNGESNSMQSQPALKRHLVTPSDLITPDSSYMRGHGTYTEDEKLHASVAGVVERVNKLISVKPLKTRYNGDIGDVVVGRVTEVGQRRWKVDTAARLESVLMLSSVNLPGGELRRKSLQDEIMMRDYLQEGDLISAEVQAVFQDGALSLHTRSLKYGKLAQGTLVKVSPSLIKRCKSHFHMLPCGVSIILGNNGFVFIAPIPDTASDLGSVKERTLEESQGTGGFLQNLEPVPRPDRECISRVRNCVLLLARHYQMLYDTSIMTAYELSSVFAVKDLLHANVAQKVAAQVYEKLRQDFS